MNRKKKICERCKQPRFLFAKKMCLPCYNITYPTFIRKKSDKRVKEDIQYVKLSKVYLTEHPFCEINKDGCTKVATEIHHTKGRGKYYLKTNTFKAVCHSCHTKITEDSKTAINNGHSQSRLKS